MSIIENSPQSAPESSETQDFYKGLGGAAEVPLQEALDNAINDERIIAKGQSIKAAREAGDTRLADELVKENRALLEQLQNDVLKENGLYLSAEEIEDERQLDLGGIQSSLSGDESDVELLQAFKLVDKDGIVQIDSPLFRADTKSAFEQYLRLVSKFAAASSVEAVNGVRLKDSGKVDVDRALAHDLTAKMVAKDLGINFDNARSIVAKMRDLRMPGSGEEEVYGTAIRRATKDLEKTGGHLSDITRPIVNRIATLESKHDAE